MAPIDSEEEVNTGRVITLKDLVNPQEYSQNTGSVYEARFIRRPSRESQVEDVSISNARTDNRSKLLLIGAMIFTVTIALLVGSYKYLNIGAHCVQPTHRSIGTTKGGAAVPQAAFINCPYDVEQQKDAGALLQSIVSGIVGIVAGMGIGARRQ